MRGGSWGATDEVRVLGIHFAQNTVNGTRYCSRIRYVEQELLGFRGLMSRTWQQLTLSAAVLLAMACGTMTEPGPWESAAWLNDVRPAGLTAVASATVSKGTTTALHLRVTFTNSTASPAELQLMGATCLIRILAYARSDRRHLRYDGLREYPVCFDVLRIVPVPAGGSAGISADIPLEASALIRIGRAAYVVAVIQRVGVEDPFLAVDAGRVDFAAAP